MCQESSQPKGPWRSPSRDIRWIGKFKKIYHFMQFSYATTNRKIAYVYLSYLFLVPQKLVVTSGNGWIMLTIMFLFHYVPYTSASTLWLFRCLRQGTRQCCKLQHRFLDANRLQTLSTLQREFNWWKVKKSFLMAQLRFLDSR